MPIADLDRGHVPGHTRGMKVTISVPKNVIAGVDAEARRLGMSRSDYFTFAVRRNLELSAPGQDAAALDALLESLGVDGPGSDTAWVLKAGRETLARVSWDDRGGP